MAQYYDNAKVPLNKEVSAKMESLLDDIRFLVESYGFHISQGKFEYNQDMLSYTVLPIVTVKIAGKIQDE